jgi:hypothetical protein
VFLHVPKAGGQTLFAIMARQYDPARTVTVLDVSDPRTAFEDVRRRAAPVLIRGHLPFGVHEELGIDPVYLTMLREPVDRVVSTYRYIRRTVEHPLHRVVNDRRMTLAGFVESDVAHREVVDWQTRQLSGRVDPDPDEATLDVAEGNLARCVAVGITERFDESLVLFRRRLRWRPPFYVSKNVAPRAIGGGALPEDARSAIVARNQLDLRLYRHAVARLDDEIRAEGAGFRVEVAAFRALNLVARGWRGLTRTRPSGVAR